MPAHERVGRDEERTPALAREEPARGGQERPVGGPKRGPRNLAPQHGELRTENDDLELLELLGAAGERDELKQASHGDVGTDASKRDLPSRGDESARHYGYVEVLSGSADQRGSAAKTADRFYAPHTSLDPVEATSVGSKRPGGSSPGAHPQGRE
jgi:hypothetical protein